MTTIRKDVRCFRKVEKCTSLEEVWRILDREKLSVSEANAVANHWKQARVAILRC